MAQPVKQDRKEYHFKLFKNPPEFAVALALAATKKAAMPWQRIFISAFMTGRTHHPSILLLTYTVYLSMGGTVSLAAAGGNVSDPFVLLTTLKLLLQSLRIGRQMVL